jgi:hypothetical protein
MEDSLAQLELEKAFATRDSGNEGMARVLARRAAGLAIRDYLSSKFFDQRGLSLNSLIKDEGVRKQLPITIHEALDRLSTRIGADFQFPENFDLLQDAQQVIEQLSIN